MFHNLCLHTPAAHVSRVHAVEVLTADGYRDGTPALPPGRKDIPDIRYVLSEGPLG